MTSQNGFCEKGLLYLNTVNVLCVTFHYKLSLSLPAPCVPSYLTAEVDCLSGITTVTWDSARGATSYTVYARGSLGHNAELNSTDTNCDFNDLLCGQVYTFTVVARRDSCVSLVSESITAVTGNETKSTSAE